MTNKFYQFLGLTKKVWKKNLIEGLINVKRAIKKSKRFYLVILSLECSENTKDKFKKIL